jgi:hypothetical protein
MEYDGVKEEAVETWGEWSGNGQAFGSGDGEWRLSVADAEGHVEVSMQHACACARSLHRSCTYSATKEAGVCMCFNLLLLPSGASRL